MHLVDAPSCLHYSKLLAIIGFEEILIVCSSPVYRSQIMFPEMLKNQCFWGFFCPRMGQIFEAHLKEHPQKMTFFPLF